MIRIAFLPALCAGILAAPALAQTAGDVPPGHWAYQAVQDLAARGLVLGYPDGRFLGGRTLTRYEMATLIKRVVDRLEARPAPSPSPAAAPVAPAATPEELAEVRRLVEEYKTELTVIGTDLQGLKGRLDEQDGKLTSLEEAVTDPEGPVQATAATVAKMAKTSIDGYIQFRWQSRSDGRDNVLPGGAGLPPVGPSPLPGNLVNAANQNSFYLRRNRIRVRHTFKDNNQAVFQIDAAKGNSVVIKDAYLTVPLQKARSLDTPLTLWAGQFNIPFGFEVQQSSSDREFPERSRGENALFNGERDRGVKLEGTLAGNAYQYQLALLNGNGVGDASTYAAAAGLTPDANRAPYWDMNRQKDFAGRFVYDPPAGKLAIGVSAYIGKSTAATGAQSGGKNLYGTYDKNRFGAELRYYGIPETKIQAEYLRGKEFNPYRVVNGVVPSAASVESWYAQVIRNLGKQNAVGVRYDVYDPDTSAPLAGQPAAYSEKIATWGVMAQRFLTDATRISLAYELPHLPRSADGKRPKQDLFTVQLQFKY